MIKPKKTVQWSNEIATPSTTAKPAKQPKPTAGIGSGTKPDSHAKKKSKRPKKPAEWPIGAVERPSTSATLVEPQKRPIDSLKRHPLQDHLFDDLPPAEFARLKQSLDEDGLLAFPNITDDGTILDGHQRVAAVKELGWTEVPCNVRREFDSPTDDSAVVFMVKRNMVRRQMDPLAEVRCFRKLKELRRGSRDGSGDTRDIVATGFSRSGRQLERLEKLLRLPRPLQQAFSRGELTQNLATRLLKLRADLQQQLAEEVQQGRPAEEVAKEYLAKHVDAAERSDRPPALAPIKRLEKLKSEDGYRRSPLCGE